MKRDDESVFFDAGSHSKYVKGITRNVNYRCHLLFICKLETWSMSQVNAHTVLIKLSLEHAHWEN